MFQKQKFNLGYFLIAVLLLFFTFSVFLTFALPSTEITYHGKLTDLSDVPVIDGNYDFVFKIFDASSGGTCLWVSQGSCGSPTTKSIAVSKGIFYTILGESGDNALTLDFNSDYWLEIKVGTNSPMSPRRKITGNNFSINSGKLNGQSSSYYLDTSSTEQTKSGNLNLSSNLALTGIFKDKDGDAGTSGQVLSSTGTGTNWVTSSGGSTTYSNVSLDASRQIGSPTTAITLDKAYDYMWSAGLYEGFALTNNGNGTVNIAGGEGVLRTSASATAPLHLVKVVGVNNLSLTNSATNYIIVNYNSGSPQIEVTTSLTDFNCLDKCILYRVSREGNEIHYIDMMANNVDANRLLRRKDFEMGNIDIGSGAVLSEVGDRYVAITAGSFWNVLSRITTPAFNTNTSDTFDLYYRNGSGGWTKTTGNTRIDNIYYDDGSGTLATLPSGKYGTRFIFMTVSESGAHIVVVMGQEAHNSLAKAESELVPGELPSEVNAVGSILAKVVIRKNESNFKSILSVIGHTFNTSIPTTHNNLAGLQGGTADEYYHLTSAQNTNLTGFSNLTLPSSDGTVNQVLKTNGSGTVSFSDQIVGGLGSVSNLRVKNNATNPNYQIDIDVDGVVVRDSSKLLQLFDLDLTADISTSGANGLDTGSEASSTWYYIWVIYNPTTSTSASLLSISSTAPTLPSGYTYKFMVGAVKNDGSSNFLTFSQINEEVWYNARQEESTNLNSTSYTTTDISDTIPTASNKVKSVLFGAILTSSGGYIFLSTDGINAKTILDAASFNNGVGGDHELYFADSASPVSIPISGNNIYYKIDSGIATLLTRSYTWSHL